MGLFSRFFGSRDAVPGWASFFNPLSYRAFVDAVERDLKRRGLRYKIDDGTVRMREPSGGTHQLGLYNLAQVCNQAGRSHWPQIVAAHFDHLFQSVGTTDKLREETRDFERARAMLKVRLYAPEAMERVEPGMLVKRDPAPGLLEMLVFDLPDTVTNVLPEQAKEWGRPDDELFEIGIENVKAEGEPGRQQTEAGEGVTIQALTGESFFIATHALFLGDYLDPPTEFGAVMSVPHRHAVLYHPIVDLRVALAIKAMLPATWGMHQEGPGSISPNLYWWRDGALTLLPSKIEGKQIEFAPPDAFVEEVLNRLPEP